MEPDPTPHRPAGGDTTVRAMFDRTHRPADRLEAQRLADRVAGALGVEGAAGTRLGRYLLGERLGAGGLGIVYRARDVTLRRDVAVKVLRGGPGGVTDQRSLCAEARALARLQHERIVQVFDIGTALERGQAQVYIAMELVEGSDLARWLAAPRPRADIVRVFIEAARGLAAIHDAGLLHRDFKPGNVLIGHDGRVRIADLGLATVARREAAVTTAPADGGDSRPATWGPVGTPRYMPPEQLIGRPLDAAADQYAFFVSLFEALVGRPPFAGRALVDLHAAKQAGVSIPARPRLPASLRAALARGLDPDPRRRFADMREVATRLQATQPRRRRWLRGAVVAVASVLGALAPIHVAPAHDVAATGAVRSAADPAASVGDPTMPRPPRATQGRARHDAVARAAAMVALGYLPEARATLESVYFDAAADADARAASAAATAMVGALAMRGETDEAGSWARTARAQLARNPAPAPSRELKLAHNLGVALLNAGALDDAHTVVAAALLGAGEDGPPRIREDLRQLMAEILLHRGRPTEALAVHEALRRDADASDAPRRLVRDLGRANALLGRRDVHAACEVYADVHARAESTLGAAHPTTATVCINESVCLAEAGEAARARVQLGPCVRTLRRRVGPEHATVTISRGIVARVALLAGDARAAKTALTAAARDLEQQLGADHYATTDALHHAGVAALQSGDAARALELLDEALGRRRRALPAGHVDIFETLAQRSRAHRARGDADAARVDLDAALAGFRARDLHPDYLARWSQTPDPDRRP